MKQRVTRELFDYWNTLRGRRRAPARADLDLPAIRNSLASTFILALDPDIGHPFRVAGTAICEFFGRELTATPFQHLWSQRDRAALADILAAVAEEADGIVARVAGCNCDTEKVELEMVLLPLTDSGKEVTLVLGALATVPPPPYWLGTRSLQMLRLGDLRFTAAGREAVAAPDFLSRRHSPLQGPGFVIYPAAMSGISRKNQG
ncbi:PAS domain-containing protein [Pseudorhodoplanes sp.]|uniref:PAS domain-containing protein n=1 Tax=Pseudorhodoplanes sp. TaxID=1934341 RepID=UPI003D114122